MMKILTTLSEVLDHCNDWEGFCQEFGWSEWAVNEGGGHVSVELTVEQVTRYGLLRSILGN